MARVARIGGQTAISPSLVPQQVAAAPAAAIEETSRELLAVRRRLEAEQRQADFNAADLAITSQLNDLSVEMSQRTDHREFPQELAARGAQIIEGVVSQLDDERVQRPTLDRAERSLLGMERTHGLRAAALARGERIAIGEQQVLQKAIQFGLATDDAGRASALADGLSSIALLGEGPEGLSTAEVNERANLFREQAGVAAAKNLIATNPDAALAALEDPDHPFAQFITPGNREILSQSARIEQRRRTATDSAFRRQKNRASQQEIQSFVFLGEGEVTVDEIVKDPWLEPAEKRHYANLLDERSRGQDINQPNHYKINDLWTDINSGRLTDISELDLALGAGLPIDVYRNMVERIESMEGSTDAKADNRMWGNFLDGSTSFIDATTMIRNDPVGAMLASEYRNAAERTMRRGLEKGLSIEQMTDPTSSDFIAKEGSSLDPRRPPWFRTNLQQEADIMEMERLSFGLNENGDVIEGSGTKRPFLNRLQEIFSIGQGETEP